jgi:enamine deaminase RidA (YjgF/YER057c/UK114 family)
MTSTVHPTTHHTAVNPWTWQDALGYSQGLLVESPHRTLYLSGQCSVGPDGAPLHSGDLPAQAEQAMDNVEAVLAAAGLTLADVVRYDVFTTDLGRYLATAHSVVAGRFASAGPFPAGGICAEVGALAMPGLMVEVVVTAAR